MTKEEYNKNRPTITCPLCGRSITNAAYSRHYQACSNPNSKMNLRHNNEIYKLDHDDLKCKFCNNEYKSKNALCQHELRCKLNPNRKAFNGLGNWSHENLLGQTVATSEVVKKYTDSNRKSEKRKNHEYKPRHVVYLYSEYNQHQIQNWFNYVDSKQTSMIIPEYRIKDNGDPRNYIIVSGMQTKQGNTVKLVYEHQYIANWFLDGNLTSKNIVHHIDGDRHNNEIHNLMVFETNEDHLRYHLSGKSRLIYNSETHLFKCILD